VRADPKVKVLFTTFRQSCPGDRRADDSAWRPSIKTEFMVVTSTHWLARCRRDGKWKGIRQIIEMPPSLRLTSCGVPRRKAAKARDPNFLNENVRGVMGNAIVDEAGTARGRSGILSG